jgi:hypothetical protein
VFIEVLLYMGMKCQSNRKSYWQKEGSVFHCPIISNIVTREQFESLTRCLHITHLARYVRKKELPGYDKMGQLRWLLNAIRDRCRRAWKLAKFVTIDKMMIRYKGSYCPSRQYMPNKPEKWGIKVWCLADSITKFVSNFQIYVEKSQDVDEEAQRARRDSTLAHGVVIDLLDGHENKGHVVTMDNYFTSVGLFKDLLSKGIYATGTVHSNRVGIPSVLKNKKAYRRSP